MEYLKTFATQLFAIDSPSGYTKNVIAFVQEEATKLGYKTQISNKGNLYIHVEGQSDKTLGICAHVDTLGLMVRSISSNGELRFTKVGGPNLPSLDGEYCKLVTRDNKIYTGTILSDYPSNHVYGEKARHDERTEDSMHIRLDEIVKNKQDVLDLGINNGDYIFIDPKTTFTESGFVKSRFLDDKMGVSCIFSVLKRLHDEHRKPKDNLLIIITTYEEVGHGNSFVPSHIDTLLAVDMGCIGEDLTCTEYDVSICAKDSSGPYDYQMTSDLITIAKTHGLQYAVDIYPYYSSDVSAALRGGNDIKGALIGPGIHASHGMERTHMQAIEATIALIYEYVVEKNALL